MKRKSLWCIPWLLFALGSAFQPSYYHNPSQKVNVLPLLGIQRHHYRQHRSSLWKPLFGRPLTDASIIASNEGYLIETLGFPEDKLKNPRTRKQLTKEIGVLEERVNWLKQRLKLEENEIKKIILSNICILGFVSEDNIEPKLDYLQQKLQLDDKLLRKIIMTNPSILNYSTEDNLEPKLNWLQQRLDLDDAAVSKMIQRSPQILGYSIPDKIEPTLHWLQKRLDLDDKALSKMIRQSPRILGSSIPKNLEPTLQWLQQRLSLADEGLSNLVQSMPTLLSCSVDTNLEPTLNFYIEALGEEAEALSLVIQNPVLFSISLERRLLPRLEEARDAGLVIDAACLRRMGINPEKQWQASIAFQARKLSRQ